MRLPSDTASDSPLARLLLGRDPSSGEVAVSVEAPGLPRVRERLEEIAGAAPANLYHIVLDNGMYAMTGGQQASVLKGEAPLKVQQDDPPTCDSRGRRPLDPRGMPTTPAAAPPGTRPSDGPGTPGAACPVRCWPAAAPPLLSLGASRGNGT